MDMIYINSQIKVIEERILNTNEFIKLSKVNKGEFLKTLNELGYGSQASNLETLVNQELASVKNYLDEVSPVKHLTDLFFLANDAINIKYYYKLKYFNLKDLGIFSNTGVFSKEELTKIIFGQDYSNLNKDYQKLFSNIDKLLKEVTDSRKLSAVVDNEIYSYILKKIGIFGSNPLKVYYQMRIDFSNLLTLIRINKLKWDFEDNKFLFIQGGLISLSNFEKWHSQNKDEILRELEIYYDGKLVSILKDYFTDFNLTKLEFNLENLQLQFMRPFQYDGFSIGPIMYYYLKKLAEAQNIRYIYVNGDVAHDSLLQY